MRAALLCASSAERLFGVQKRLRAFLYPIFMGGVVAANGICSAAFCESAALRRTNPLRLIVFTSSSKGEAFCHLPVSVTERAAPSFMTEL